MPIYARNSLGSNVKITANENYSYADMGRILSECVQNDMTLFNAVLLNDFKENTAIREGTMVSSELTSFREFSVKEAWAGLKKKLQKLWEKIKGVFRQVYAKLTVWFVRHGKAFVAANRKILANKKGLDSCKIPVYIKVKNNADFSKIAGDICDRASKFIEANSEGSSTETSDEYVNTLLRGTINASDATPENYSEKFKDYALEEVKNTTWSDVKKTESLEDLFGTISTGGKEMRKLKKLERDTDSAIKKVISSLKKAEGDDKEANKKYTNASKACSAYERAVTITTRCCISAIRSRIGNARQIVGKLVAYSPNTENAIYEEMAWLEAADDFAAADEIPAEEINADDVQSDPDVEINVTVDDDGNECSK